MAGIVSRAQAVWQGDLMQGSGRLSLDSGIATDVPISWATRTQRQSGTTSPEELLAAAHASCYAMALSNVLGKRGTPAQQLDVSAECTFAPADGGFEISTMQLSVRGRVPGISREDFQAAAEQGEQGCPVSNALRGNVRISVSAQLED